ncbi:MAG: hypothetical protein CXT67_09765, partial [Methanobacteriota archaeon]
LCVGRAHLIDEASDGSAADHAGPGASTCPAFGPLQANNAQNRPSIQIRQMGTRQQGRRQGLATAVLAVLETESIQHFSAKTGLLQAREDAFAFYQSQHWQMIDSPYIIEKIGPHHSITSILDKWLIITNLQHIRQTAHHFDSCQIQMETIK